MLQDAELDPSIQQPKGDFAFQICTDTNTLNGATGFLGAYLLRDLLNDGDIEHVCVLVRADSAEHAMTRIRRNLEKYGIWEQRHFDGRLSCALGDFTQSRLVLEQSMHEELASNVDTVIHSGARVDYTRPYRCHVAANVQGTVRMIQFYSDGRQKALHFVSTLAVFGPVGSAMGTTDVFEDDNLESTSTEAIRLDTGYPNQNSWQNAFWRRPGSGYWQ
ncbi:Reducing polyketide synthase swnK [Seminavis robusta]|uniref:Reducing polyketide synthase swnK n=1 Tax=Seminavis robusta TaxID=568900 RepID=A0A9N8H360_9STRA|nr:Reducing polyketide synthase swnK [Seminavis robusta]|eukprot:Sro81_g043450.1 Reducing polyketide synthase swnK (218) ;mRNA; r:46249-46902